VRLHDALFEEYIAPNQIGTALTCFEYAFSLFGEPHVCQARSLTDPRERIT